MKPKKAGMLAASVLVCLFAGFIGSFFTVQSIPMWYASINKPAFTPPNWVFGPVWTTLYVLMGVAFFLVWSKGINSQNERLAAGLFFSQLVLNAVWSIFFFGLREPGLAFGEIIFLWLAIAGTMYYFYGIDKRAFALMVPYICWVSFAAFLNYSVWALN